jgi:Icc-related predicted phosphoesterase
MHQEFDRIDLIFEDNGMPDILVAHCPPAGMCDTKFGNTVLRNRIEYVWNKLPSYCLVGHEHQPNQRFMYFNNMEVINTATTTYMLNYK